MKQYFNRLTGSVTALYERVAWYFEDHAKRLDAQQDTIQELVIQVSRLRAAWESSSQFENQLSTEDIEALKADLENAQKRGNERMDSRSDTRSPIRWGTQLQRVYCYLRDHSGKEGITTAEIAKGMDTKSRPASSIYELKKRGWIQITGTTSNGYNHSSSLYAPAPGTPVFLDRPPTV